ncbi:MAG: hypothetical protein Q8L48_17330 [Archangium sp.]|nr:hypothetical protein [Archangium sp.]
MERFRGVDILGLLLGGLCLVEAVVGLGLQPGYRAMFNDFQATLPLVTRVMLQPVTLVVAGVGPLLLVGEGVLRKRSEVAQVARCAVALFAVIGLMVAFVVATYLPVFQLGATIE